MSNTDSTAETETLAILPQFLGVLQSSSPITIPSQTFLGGVTHFLSQLDPPHLQDFTKALVTSTSPSLWATTSAASSTSLSKGDIREAIRLSVSAKAERVRLQTSDLYFAQRRGKKRAHDWLYTIIRAAEEAQGGGKVHFFVALLQGLDDTDLEWGKARVWLEEDVVFHLSQMLEVSAESEDRREGVMLLCEAVPHVDGARLWALDIKHHLGKIESHLLSTLSHPVPDEDSSSASSRALARCFEVLSSGGPGSREHALVCMRSFCEDMRGVARRLEREHTKVDGSKGTSTVLTEEEWVKHKTSLFSFLLTASTIVDILLTASPAPGLTETVSPSIPSSRSLSARTDLAVQLLSTLAAFSYLESQGGLDNHHRILFGSMDIIAEQGTMALDALLSSIWDEEQGSLGDARATFVLVVGEEMVHHLSSRSLDRLLPRAERPSFEAAHSFLLRLLVTSSETLSAESPVRQSAFFDALLPYYLAILTKQAKRGDITPDQLTAAFPMIVESASRRSPSSVHLCLSFLSTLPPSSTRTIRISLAPHIPSADLAAYLDDVADMIIETGDGSEERLDLSKKAFEMVSKDLGDDVKGLGVRWWTENRGRFGGYKKQVGWLRSRL